MRILNLKTFQKTEVEILKTVLLFVILVLLWPVVQRLILNGDATAGYVDPGILVLIVLSLTCFLMMIGLCWWLLQRFWLILELPAFGSMVLQFKTLTSWQQLGFYFASFALLLSAGVMCLMAIC